MGMKKHKHQRPGNCLLLFSGGMDSTYLLHTLLKTQEGKIFCLSFDYGQPHARQELKAAKLITAKLGVDHIIEKIDFDFMQTDMAGDNPVVPNRNAIFLTLASAIATTKNCQLVYIGCTQSDYEVFADCRSLFIRAIDEAMTLSCNVRVIAPLVGITKAKIVKSSSALGVDLNETWSCYAGNDEPCGTCLACKERAAAFV
jgi:7-cyano-7-deazaguanine synthase